MGSGDGVSPEVERGAVIEAARQKTLDREFGVPLPKERVMAMKVEVQSRLDGAPMDDGKLSKIFPGKRLKYFLSGSMGEFFTVDLKRRIPLMGGETRDEIRVSRWFLQPVREWEGGGTVEGARTAVRSDDLGFLMLDTPGSNTLPVVNLHQDNLDKLNETNLDFIGECGMNGVSQEELRGLDMGERKKYGMFAGGDGMLATRELRDNWEDQTALFLIERALIEGRQISLDELHSLQEKLGRGERVSGDSGA